MTYIQLPMWTHTGDQKFRTGYSITIASLMLALLLSYTVYALSSTGQIQSYLHSDLTFMSNANTTKYKHFVNIGEELGISMRDRVKF